MAIVDVLFFFIFQKWCYTKRKYSKMPMLDQILPQVTSKKIIYANKFYTMKLLIPGKNLFSFVLLFLYILALNYKYTRSMFVFQLEYYKILSKYIPKYNHFIQYFYSNVRLVLLYYLKIYKK